MPRPPAALTSSAVSSNACGNSGTAGRPRVLRPVTYTVAPSPPSTTAMPRPAPLLAPVTRATLPSITVMTIRMPHRTRAAPPAQLTHAERQWRYSHRHVRSPASPRDAVARAADDLELRASRVRAQEPPSAPNGGAG